MILSWILITIFAIYYSGIIYMIGFISYEFGEFNNLDYYEFFYAFIWPVLVALALYNHYTES